jgi:hypothetical protein
MVVLLKKETNQGTEAGKLRQAGLPEGHAKADRLSNFPVSASPEEAPTVIPGHDCSHLTLEKLQERFPDADPVAGGSVGVTTSGPHSIPPLWLPSWLLASVPGEK